MLGPILVSVVCVTLTAGQGNLVYDGGSVSSYYVGRVNETIVRMHLVVLTGWQLKSSPCDRHCILMEVNYHTKSRLPPVPGTNAILLGKWTAQASYGSNIKTYDITDYVTKHSVSYKTAVNTQDDWELVVTEFDIDVDMTADYTDITLSGPKWRPYHLEDKTSATETDLQIKLKPHLRSDTGLPNTAPMVIFKPVYRLPLNQVSHIHLAPVDLDGDAVICEKTAFASAGGIVSPANIIVHKDCTIEVAAYESLGYTDDGWEAVALVMSDYNRDPITMGSNAVLKPYFRYLSQHSIQFMIHTVKTVTGPSFIDPTPADRHVFVIEADTPFNVTLATSGNSPIKTFHVSSIPFARVDLAFTTGQTGQLSWRPKHQDVGSYVMQIRATDNNGAESSERTFILHVRDREFFTFLKHPTGSEFAYIPTTANIKCRVGDTCIIGVPVITSFLVASLGTDNGVDLIGWQESHGSPPATHHYQADIKVENMAAGEQNLCLVILKLPSNSIPKFLCFNVSVEYRDACDILPCKHYGECVSYHGKFICNCLSTYTGSTCETEIDVCSPSPCVHGKCYRMFTGASPFFCQCHPGFSGTRCDIGGPTSIKVTPSTTTTTVATKTATTIATTTVTTTETTSTTTTPTITTTTTSAATTTTTEMMTSTGDCVNQLGINCNLLNVTSPMCTSIIGPRYCPRFCHIC